jgi:hypothetical protein
MRRIASSLLVVGVALALGLVVLVKQFVAKPADANLAEIGLSNDPDQLAAPAEPAPLTEPSRVAAPEVINLLATPMNTAGKQSAGLSDSSLLPASFIDTAGAAALDNSAYRWMPLCREPAPTDKKTNGLPDRMPRWNQ